MGPDPFAQFAKSYIAGKLAEIAIALDDIDGQADPLSHAETRRRLVEIQAQLIAAPATLPAG